MCSGRGDSPLRLPGFPIRTSPDQSLVADSRGLSQAPTSFFGSWCQGIRRVPLLTWQLQMLASTVQFSKYGRSQCPDRRVPQLSKLGPFDGKLVLAEGGA